MRIGLLLSLLILSLLMSPSFANADVFTAQNAVIDLDISGALETRASGVASSLSSLTVNLSLVPQSSSWQKVAEFTSEPPGQQSGDSYLFSLPPRNNAEFQYSVTASVETHAFFPALTTKVQFPLSGLEPAMKAYTMPQDIIDSDNEAVAAKAQELAEGEDDLYVVVFKIASWTREHVEYNLSTLTADASQKASWVLENRYGVCDEITSLFIAMVRSLGIPARYISGIAYTNYYLFGEDFVSHGWAEVYFPGYGWVPFDVTYGELGYVDPGHVLLKRSMDAGEPSTRFEWVGRNVDVVAGPLSIKGSLASFEGTQPPLIRMSARPYQAGVGFGSYDLIEVEIGNPGNYYLATEVVAAKIEGLEILGSLTRDVLLKPGQSKKEYFIVKVPPDLNKKLRYTFPVAFYADRNVSASASFQSSAREAMLTRAEVEEVVSQQADEERKVYSSRLSMKCGSDSAEIYMYEQAGVSCELQNTGNVQLRNLSVCLGEDCRVLDIGISREESVKFDFIPAQAGNQTIRVVAENSQVSKSERLSINVLDEPMVDISDISAPEIVGLESFDLSFTVAKKSYSVPVNAEIGISNGKFKRTWHLDRLNQTEKITYSLNGKYLDDGPITVNAVFEDNNGNVYSQSAGVNIARRELTVPEKLQVFFFRLLLWSEKALSQLTGA